jgi:superfamily II DNA or RNA helicase
MLFQQIIGRCLRIADGKDHALILDHSDTTLNLGFVTEIHWDRLDDGKPHVTRILSGSGKDTESNTGRNSETAASSQSSRFL